MNDKPKRDPRPDQEPPRERESCEPDPPVTPLKKSIPEHDDNLQRRSEWFKRRTGK